MTIVDPSLVDGLTSIAARAATLLLSMSPSSVTTRYKADQSPVTAADEACETLILESLGTLLPGVPVVSEEAVARGHRYALGLEFLLVDPLDGTKEFLGGRPDFAINIAFVVDHAPVAGIIAAPAQGVLWRGVVGTGAERLSLRSTGTNANTRVRIGTRAAPSGGLVVMVSRSHLDSDTASFVARLPERERVACGSAIKFGWIAEGSADVYPRLAPTSEWDVAAGQALVEAAGGIVVRPGGDPVRYGAADSQFRIPAFIAWGDPAAPQRSRP